MSLISTDALTAMAVTASVHNKSGRSSRIQDDRTVWHDRFIYSAALIRISSLLMLDGILTLIPSFIMSAP